MTYSESWPAEMVDSVGDYRFRSGSGFEMVTLVLTIAGGMFLTVIVAVVVWVAAFRDNYGPHHLLRGDEEARGDYIGGSGRAPGDYVGGPFF